MTDAVVAGAEITGAASSRAPYQYTWASLGASQNGAPVQRPGDVGTLQITGTFGGTVVMQGSEDGTTWFTLKDTLGNAITCTANSAFVLTRLPANVRPSAGSGVTGVVAVMTVTKP